MMGATYTLPHLLICEGRFVEPTCARLPPVQERGLTDIDLTVSPGPRDLRMGATYRSVASWVSGRPGQVTARAPHRSGRAEFPHPALQQGKTVLAESLRPHLHHPARIGFVSKYDDEVIRIPDQVGRSPHPR